MLTKPGWSPVRGFILPLVLGLIVIMASMGAWYLFSTIHSKNVFQVFFRDELTRTIAESALAEWRSNLLPVRLKDPKWRNLFLHPKSAPVVIPITDLPHTKALADQRIGAGQWGWSAKAAIRNVDDELWETVGGIRKKGAFGQEYQGTLRLEISVGLGLSSPGPTNQHFASWANFSYEFDVKHVCLRSRPQDRRNRGYTSTALNDYVLFVRGGHRELADPPTWAASVDGTLTIGHADNARKGLVFLGGANPAAISPTGKFIFMDGLEQLTSQPPDPPLVGRTGPVDVSRFLPFTGSLVQSRRFANARELFDSPSATARS